MTSRDKLKQCELVFKYVHRYPKKTQAEIIEYVESEREEFMDVDSAYIEKDKPFRRLLEKIKTEYGIYIKAGGDKEIPCAKNQYVIVESDVDVDDQIELYETADSLGISTGNLNKLRKMKSFIEFSNTQDIRKPEHVSKLLDFCIKSREVEFNYLKYGEDVPRKRKVQPYKIKQYQGRWYLIGIEPDLAAVEPHPEIVKFRAYGLERIHNLEKGNSFKRDKATDKAYNDHYADVIGIVNGYNYQEGTNIKAEKISLRVDEFWWNYIKASPWHRSQKQVNKTDGRVEFELFVKPTSELVELIMQWSPKVKVLEPAILRKKVLAQLEESMTLYK